ncbi:MAG: cysteine hydrolase [Spirochaetes bacterium]|nr:cysteine hydrolase [Spirochaetota bacterium]MBU1079283.1 cysteine hydrolase [Spirochaetota bacterium]
MNRGIPAALVVVDLQRYYLEAASPFYSFTELSWPGSMSYIGERVRSSVFPAVTRLKAAFDALGWPTVYLRLCSGRPDRSDLHRFFRTFWSAAEAAGYADAYPLSDDPWADVPDEVAPGPADIVIDKASFSGFSSPELEKALRERGVGTVVMAGLATSQCVDTTARDASERGFIVVHAEDAQADYSDDEHEASLFASRGVCGGHVVDSEFLAAAPERLIKAFADSENR